MSFPHNQLLSLYNIPSCLEATSQTLPVLWRTCMLHWPNCTISQRMQSRAVAVILNILSAPKSLIQGFVLSIPVTDVIGLYVVSEFQWASTYCINMTKLNLCILCFYFLQDREKLLRKKRHKRSSRPIKVFFSGLACWHKTRQLSS